MPRKGTKSQKLVDQAFEEVNAYPPKLKTRGGPEARRRQLAAIAISKARKQGAKVPKRKKSDP